MSGNVIKPRRWSFKPTLVHPSWRDFHNRALLLCPMLSPASVENDPIRDYSKHKRVLTLSSSTPGVFGPVATPDGIGIASAASLNHIKVSPKISITSGQSWTLHWRTATSISKMICGDASISNEYMWLRTGVEFRYRVASGTRYQWTNVTDFSAWATWTLVFDDDANTLELFEEGISKGTKSLSSSSMVIDAILNGQANTTYVFSDPVSFFHVLDGADSQEEIRRFVRDPYGPFAMADDFAAWAPGAGGPTLTGVAQNTATAQGELATAITISGNADVIATVAGELSTGIALSGTASATAVAQGELGTEISLAGSAQVSAAAAGELITEIDLSGTAVATATAAGDLSSGPGAQLSGNAQASATASGELTTGISLSDTAPATAVTQGELSTAITLSGTADVIATVAGELTTGIVLSGVAVAAAVAQGELSTAITLSGLAAVSVTASGELNGGTGPVFARDTAVTRTTPAYMLARIDDARDVGRVTAKNTIARI